MYSPAAFDNRQRSHEPAPWLAALIGLSLFLLPPVSSTAADNTLDALRQQQAYLRSLPLAQLVELDVTGVSRRPQQLANAAAAVFVITLEDIRRSGVTSIPEALRMAPGVHVARLDASKWAISARGFNNRFANKLQVLIDGRSVYTPLFSGVYWDEQDLPLEEVERIEVIRGPGATLWGANAVNGVINVVTRDSAQTQGSRLIASVGNEEKGALTLRHGGALDELGHYRLYGRFISRDGGLDEADRPANDDWDKASAGLRLDLQGGNGDQWLLDSRIFDGENGQTLTVPQLTPPYTRSVDDPVGSRGGHLLGRWEGKRNGHSTYRLQGYFDYTDRDDPAGRQMTRIYDLDFQHRYTAVADHEIVWGLGLRHIDNQVSPGAIPNPIDPPNHELTLFSAFLQGEASLLDNRLRITVGSKFEHNDFTGFEVQPNLRAAWKATPDSTLWGSVSRAVRTPSIFERDGEIPFQVIPGALPLQGNFSGDPGYEAETLTAYEFGYRISPGPTLNLDLAAYYNDYEDLRTGEQGEATLVAAPLPHLELPLFADNRLRGQGYGFEAAVKWHPLQRLRFDLAYTWFELDLELDPASTDFISAGAGGDDPRHQLSLRGAWNPAPDWELNAWLRYVDELPSLGIDNYLTLDLRVAWRATEDLEISLVGQNLLDSPRQEFLSQFVQNPPTQVQRGIYLKLDWKL